MSGRIWIAIVSVVLLVVLLAGAGVAALILVPRHRAERQLAQARAHRDAGEWSQARKFYQDYVWNHADPEVLREYITACINVTDDRRRSLQAAGRAYIKIAQLQPENGEIREEALEFYKTYRFWQELERAIASFHGSDRTKLSDELAYERAVAIQEQGRVPAAVEEWEAYLGITGDRVTAPFKDAPLRLARAYRQRDRERDAEALFATLQEQRGEDGMLSISHATYLLDLDRVDEASTQLASVPESLHENMDYLLVAARLASESGDSAAAVAHTRKAVDLDTANVDAQLAYILALEQNNQRAEAVAHVEAMDENFRIDTPSFLMYLFEVKASDSKIDEADAVRETYRRAYPDQMYVDDYLKGRIAFALGQESAESYQEARDRFVMAVQMNPNLDRARYFLALTELELGNKGAARTPLEVYIRKNPFDERARRLWDRYYDTEKSLFEFRIAAKRLLEQTNPDAEDLIFNAAGLQQQGNAEDQQLVEQLLKKAVETNPPIPDAFSALAYYYLETDNPGQAEKVMAAAAAAGVESVNFPLLNSGILLAKGEVGAALEHARAQLDSASPGDLRTWALLFAQNGHLSEGDALLKDAITNLDAPLDRAEMQQYRLSLAMRYGTLNDATHLLEEAETMLISAETEAVLNRMRLALVQALIQQTPMDQQAVDGLLAKMEASDPEDDGLIVARTRLELTKSLPDYEKAAAAMAAIPEDSANYVDARQLLAEIHYRRGRYDQVEEAVAAILEKTPRNTTALLLLGDAKIALRKMDEARATMEQVLEIDRTDMTAMRALVRIYSELNLAQKAQAMYERFRQYAASIPGASANVQELGALLAQTGGELADSEAKLASELASNPDNYTAVTGLVRSLVMQGRYEEGIDQLRAYLDRNPNAAESWVFLGQVILEYGKPSDLSEASTAFTRALILVPDYAPAQLGQVDVQIRNNQFKVAISLCQRYLKNRPDDVDALFRLASLLSGSESTFATSLDTINRALALAERPEFLRLRAFLNVRLGDFAGAIADVERLVKLTNATTADDDITLAEAQLGMNNPEKARAALDGARTKIAEGDTRIAARAEAVEARLVAAGGVQ